jgi:REP-associated tyrosine transposase
MSRYMKLSHVIYYHVYHLIWTPKYRFRVLGSPLQEFTEEQIRTLYEWKRVEILELNVQLPPKISISHMLGILKGKTAIKLFKSFTGLKKKPYLGNHFWSRGYCSSTVGLDEEKIRKYDKYQEQQEKLIENQQQGFDFRPLWGYSKAIFSEGGFFTRIGSVPNVGLLLWMPL